MNDACSAVILQSCIPVVADEELPWLGVFDAFDRFDDVFVVCVVAAGAGVDADVDVLLLDQQRLELLVFEFDGSQQRQLLDETARPKPFSVMGHPMAYTMNPDDVAFWLVSLNNFFEENVTQTLLTIIYLSFT